MRVGFVGAGRMGSPMVERLVRAGHDVVVLGRTDEKRSAAVRLGAHAVRDIAGVADGADAVVVSRVHRLPGRRAVSGRRAGGGHVPGAALVLHTTGSPATARSIATRFAHVDVIDAPLSGGPHDIAAGHVTVFTGGSDDAMTRVAPLLGAYADPIVHAGATGAGSWSSSSTTRSSQRRSGSWPRVRLGNRLGVEEGRLLQALTHGSAQSRVLSLIAAAGSADAFIAGVGEFLGKDVAVVRATVAELGGDLSGLDALVDAGARA